MVDVRRLAKSKAQVLLLSATLGVAGVGGGLGWRAVEFRALEREANTLVLDGFTPAGANGYGDITCMTQCRRWSAEFRASPPRAAGDVEEAIRQRLRAEGYKMRQWDCEKDASEVKDGDGTGMHDACFGVATDRKHRLVINVGLQRSKTHVLYTLRYLDEV